MKTGRIYCAENWTNGKRYVGKERGRMWNRREDHENLDGTAIAFDNAIRKYGPENFIWTILMDGIPEESLNAWEKFFVVLLKSRTFEHGYNIAPGGLGMDSIAAREIANRPENRARNSAALLAFYANNPQAVVENSARGLEKWQDPDYRAKHAIAMEIVRSDPLFWEKVSAGISKVMNQPEMIEHLRECANAQWSSQEARDNQSAIMTEICNTQEWTERKSASQIENWEDEDYRNRQTALIRGGWAKKKDKREEERQFIFASIVGSIIAFKKQNGDALPPTRTEGIVIVPTGEWAAKVYKHRLKKIKQAVAKNAPAPQIITDDEFGPAPQIVATQPTLSESAPPSPTHHIIPSLTYPYAKYYRPIATKSLQQAT